MTFEKEGRKQLGLTVGFAIQQPRPVTGVKAVSGKARSGVQIFVLLLFEMSHKMIFFSKSDSNVQSNVLATIPAGVAVLSMVASATQPLKS